MNVGIKASLAENDVKSATLDNLTFTSNYPVFKVNQEGAGTVIVPAATELFYTETAHDLGYRPFVVGFAEPESASGRRLLLCGRTPAAGTPPRKYLHTDATDFTVIYEKGADSIAGVTFNFYAYTMIDQVAA